MKLAIIFLVCLPAVLCAPEKRFFLDSITNILNLDMLKADLQIMLDVLGGDPTETACESECHKLLSTGHVLNYGCGLVCHSFQELVHQFSLTTPSVI